MKIHATCSTNPCRKGFTLVEVSIVMVIIALIVGGIMTGTTLLRTARLRTIMTDKQKYEESVEIFREKYKAFPGDMANATAIWGAENNDPNACMQLVTASTDKKTCNGNGDDSISQAPVGTEPFHEQFRMWQQLANAGLIEGAYAGVNACNSDTDACYKVGWNAPASSLRTATWALYDMGAEATLPGHAYSGQEYHHIMYFGGERLWTSYPFGRILLPKEAWSIDVKFDDGLPGKGKILTLKPQANAALPTANQCATTSVADTAQYKLTRPKPSNPLEQEPNENLECMFLFRLNF